MLHTVCCDCVSVGLAMHCGRSCDECVTVVERIHSCYHPSLASDNKHLLEV